MKVSIAKAHIEVAERILKVLYTGVTLKCVEFLHEYKKDPICNTPESIARQRGYIEGFNKAMNMMVPNVDDVEATEILAAFEPPASESE